MKENITSYVKQHLPRELTEVKSMRSSDKLLTVEEEAIIRKYTDDGYESVNENLRNGYFIEAGGYADTLEFILAKLPNYADLVYRGVDLNKNQMAKYEAAYREEKSIIEPCFTSTSKSKLIANSFSKGKVLFTIFSRNGKDIEQFAKFGTGSGQNEQEVVFRPNTAFDVLDITSHNGMTFITLYEVDTNG